MGLIYFGCLNDANLVLQGPLLSASNARALDQSTDILNAANEEAESIKQRAQERGYAEGLAKGQAEIASVLADLHLQANRHIRDLEPVFVDCIVDVVRTLVGEVESHRLIERAVLRVHSYLADLSGLILRVSPSSVNVAEKAVEGLAGEHGIVFPMRVVADHTLGNDECILESPLGRATVNLNEQVARLRSAVERALAQLPQST